MEKKMLRIIACGLAFSAVSASELVAQPYCGPGLQWCPAGCQNIDCTCSEGPFCGIGCTEEEKNKGSIPCGGKCYPKGYQCYGGEIGGIACKPNYQPCGTEGDEKLCSPKGSIPCGGKCYPKGYQCHDGIPCGPDQKFYDGKCWAS